MRLTGHNIGARAFSLTTLGIAALCMMPLIAVWVIACLPDQGSVAHMASTVLPRYIGQSLLLVAGVGALALAMGVLSAWYVTIYDFPFRHVLQWLLLFPLAVPSYVAAMAYGDLFDAAGLVQEFLRERTGLAHGEYWFPDVRSLGGAIMVLAFVLYPYVYVLARLAFKGQCASLFESALLLGAPPRRWFRLIALPVARPALAVGVSLVAMETLADFGAVSLFGVSNLTTGIYRAWFAMGDPVAAAKLAAILLLIVIAAIGMERYLRRAMRYGTQGAQSRAVTRIRIRGMAGWLKTLQCAVPFVLGFAVPVASLVSWSMHGTADWNQPQHWQALRYSVVIAACAGVSAVLIAVMFAYYLRFYRLRLGHGMIRLALLGYAIPGSVIAVGIFIPMLMVDKAIANAVEAYSGVRPALFITGSIAAIVMACTIRFLAVAAGGVESALGLIPQRVDDAARLLGSSGAGLAVRLHLPQLKLALLVAGFMVFTDTLKELPATLLLRPFNVNTLAIHTYELAKDGWLVQASIPALFMIGISLLAVLLLAWQQRDRME